MFSIVGDIGGNYKSETESFTEQGVTFTGTAKANIHTFLGGIRLRAGENPRVSPFAQILFGAARATASVEATVGGAPLIDFEEVRHRSSDVARRRCKPAAGSLRRRVQAEWLKILEDDSGNAFRFGVGIVIPF